MDRREDSETKKGVSLPGKKSEASTADGSSTKVPTPKPLRLRAEEVFALRWPFADKLCASDKLCRRVWADHELLGCLGEGRYGRVFLVKHWPSNSKTALKLCSMMRIGRGRTFEPQVSPSAILDYKHPPSKFDEPKSRLFLSTFVWSASFCGVCRVCAHLLWRLTCDQACIPGSTMT